jgi:hypothetical protein
MKGKDEVGLKRVLAQERTPSLVALSNWYNYKLYMNGQLMKVYMLIVYIIHVKCDDIKLNHHLRLYIACNFIYTTNGILAIHVGYNLFLVGNCSCKLKCFF